MKVTLIPHDTLSVDWYILMVISVIYLGVGRTDLEDIDFQTEWLYIDWK